MQAYRVHYTADNRKHNILILAASEKDCRKQLKKIFKEMGFDDAEVVRILVIEE